MATVHEDTLDALFNTLSRKANIGTGGARVGAGWLKYAWNDSIWNLDDGPSRPPIAPCLHTSQDNLVADNRPVYSRRLCDLCAQNDRQAANAKGPTRFHVYGGGGGREGHNSVSDTAHAQPGATVA